MLIGRHTVLDVRTAELDLLRALPKGCLIAPNHSHYFDAQVTFELTRRARRRVVYMATRELFDSWWGLAGWLYQRLGVFSVNRGGTNREGRQFARAVLTQGRYDLLMFPEGGIYHLNDLVMPLKPGVARLAVEAAGELVRAGRDDPIFVVPVAIKYRYTEDIGAALETLMRRLETRIWGNSRAGPLYPRIVALGTELLARQERLHGVEVAAGEVLFDRIRHLREHLLRQLELKYGGQVGEGFDFDRARKLMIRIQGALLGTGGAGGPGDYDGRIAPSAPNDADSLTRDLEIARLCARSVAFQDDYLLENPTQERMAETLVKLEIEVLGTETRTFGKRRAIISIADPIDVREFLQAQGTTFVDDELIEAVVIRVHQSLQGALDAIEDEQGRVSC